MLYVALGYTHLTSVTLPSVISDLLSLFANLVWSPKQHAYGYVYSLNSFIVKTMYAAVYADLADIGINCPCAFGGLFLA